MYFCKVFFKESAKCDSVDNNNMAEIFNAFIIEQWFNPIVTMLEDIFRIIMTRVASKKKIAYHLDLSICPTILKKIEKEKTQSRWWQASPRGNGMYDVKYGCKGFVVDILGKTCTCGAWLLSEISCFHALAVMREKKLNPIPFIHDCNSVKMLRNTYTHTLQPCNGSNMWALSEHDPIVAPKFKKKKRGYYSFKRRPEEGETRSCTPYGTVPRAGLLEGQSSALRVAVMAITSRRASIW